MADEPNEPPGPTTLPAPPLADGITEDNVTGYSVYDQTYRRYATGVTEQLPTQRWIDAHMPKGSTYETRRV